MDRLYRSLDEARQAFDAYVRIEPRLAELWEQCREAAPPVHTSDADDVYDVDAFDIDDTATDKPDAGWCAEDFFFDEVKSELMLLVGVYRRTGPAELQTTKAYDAVYELLLQWALNRSCTCCAEHVDTGDDRRVAP